MKNDKSNEQTKNVAKRKSDYKLHNSPVIGDNGVIMGPGDASKAAKAVYNMILSDAYFGDVFAEIRSDADVRALASTPLDVTDVGTMKRRFVGFVAQCMLDDIRFGNEMAYTAIGISKDNVYNWEHGRLRTEEHRDFIKKIKGFCSAYRECLGANGLLNPVTLVWWQKNYDGLTDRQEVVVTPKNPLGDFVDKEQLVRRIRETTIDVDD